MTQNPPSSSPILRFLFLFFLSFFLFFCFEELRQSPSPTEIPTSPEKVLPLEENSPSKILPTPTEIPSPFLEEEEKRTLTEIPALQLLSLFHKEQQKALALEIEQASRNIRALSLMRIFRQTGKSQPANDKSEFPELWNQPLHKLNTEIEHWQTRATLLRQIQKNLQQEKMFFLKNFYSYDELLLEIAGRPERFSPPQNASETLWMLFHQLFQLQK